MSISIRLKNFLDEKQIPYSVLTHTTAYTAEGAAATMQISGKVCATSYRAGIQHSLPRLRAGRHATVRLSLQRACVR